MLLESLPSIFNDTTTAPGLPSLLLTLSSLYMVGSLNEGPTSVQ
jgi:hypothetical protein